MPYLRIPFADMAVVCVKVGTRRDFRPVRPSSNRTENNRDHWAHPVILCRRVCFYGGKQYICIVDIRVTKAKGRAHFFGCVLLFFCGGWCIFAKSLTAKHGYGLVASGAYPFAVRPFCSPQREPVTGCNRFALAVLPCVPLFNVQKGAQNAESL